MRRVIIESSQMPSQSATVLAEFYWIELVPEFVDEHQFRNWHTILLPNYLLDRIAKTYHHSGLDIGWETKILPHCLFLDSRIDSGDYPVVPGRELHLLYCASR